MSSSGRLEIFAAPDEKSGTVAPPARELVDIHGPIEMHPDLDPTAPLPHERKPKPTPKKVHKMNPPAKIVIVNKSKNPSLTAAILASIVAALSVQLARDVAPVWGTVPALEVGTDPAPGDSTITIQDALDVDGALGYHDEANGTPRGFIGLQVILDNGGTLTSGSNSLSVTLSHELIEMVGDYGANLWADAPDGADFARELCDAVESDSYEIDGIAVSSFLYPAFFDGQADSTEKLDHLGMLTKPFTMTAGGYQIRRTEPGKIAQVFGATFVHIVAGEKGRQVSATFGAAFPKWKVPGKIAKLRKRLQGVRKAA